MRLLNRNRFGGKLTKTMRGLKVMSGGLPAWIKKSALFDMDYANERYYGALPLTLTNTRNAPGYAFTQGGVAMPFTSNSLRKTNRGLLCEEARTNILPNNSMQGASVPSGFPTGWVFSTITGVTRTISAIGTKNGVEYIDIAFSGTSTALAGLNISFNNVTVSSAAQGQKYVGSAFFEIVKDTTNVLGTYPFRHEITERDNVGSSLAGGALQSITVPTWDRSNVVATLSNALTAFVVYRMTTTSIPISTVFDIIIRIGWPQLEQGTRMTSPIRTVTVPVTRDADVIEFAPGLVTSQMLNATEFTWFAEIEQPKFPVLSEPGIIMMRYSSDYAKYTELFAGNLGGGNAGAHQLLSFDGVNFPGLSTNTNGVEGTIYKMALGIKVNAGQGYFSMDGGAAAIPINGAMVVPDATNGHLYIGTALFNQWFNGYIRRIAGVPKRLTDAEIAAWVTSP